MHYSRVSSLGLLLANAGTSHEASAHLHVLPDAQGTPSLAREQPRDREWVRSDFVHPMTQH